jgi:hypothetical protein
VEFDSSFADGGQLVIALCRFGISLKEDNIRLSKHGSGLEWSRSYFVKVNTRWNTFYN